MTALHPTFFRRSRTERGIAAAQRSVGEKPNEITQSRPLLKDVDLDGKTVTADAMYTQTAFARFVVE